MRRIISAAAAIAVLCSCAPATSRPAEQDRCDERVRCARICARSANKCGPVSEGCAEQCATTGRALASIAEQCQIKLGCAWLDDPESCILATALMAGQKCYEGRLVLCHDGCCSAYDAPRLCGHAMENSI